MGGQRVPLHAACMALLFGYVHVSQESGLTHEQCIGVSFIYRV